MESVEKAKKWVVDNRGIVCWTLGLGVGVYLGSKVGVHGYKANLERGLEVLFKEGYVALMAPNEAGEMVKAVNPDAWAQAVDKLIVK